MEVLRVNVVYFLSRSGRVEHPHLIRVHHRSRNGVRLLDVKRWLAEIRGKDMPDTFAWSYKRKYRTGYVWQDLIVDDDLITPVSDNEYVLKGSQILHANAALANQHHFLSLDNSPAPSIQGKEKAPGAADDDGQKAEVETHPKSSSPTSEILQQDDDDEFTSSGASDEPTIWRKAVFKIDAFRQRVGKEKVAAEVAKEGAPRGRGGVRTVRSSGSDGNSYAKRATEALWSILTCRYNCTDDEALHPILRRREKGRSGGAGAGTDGGVLNQNDSSRKERAKRKGPKRMGEKGAVHPTSFNPAYVPDCSQCGRAFKPEKLHIHMKSCNELAKERKKIA